MRKLLIVNSTALDADLLQAIATAGWEVYPAHTARRFRALNQAHRFQVGLMAISPEDELDALQWMIDLIPGYRQIEWVAALPRSWLLIKPMAALLCEHFYDYHGLPIDPYRLLTTLGHLHGMVELAALKHQQARQSQGQYGFIGNSPALRVLYRNIARAAQVDVPVLISGENGTGKELTARAIHEHSARATSPFVAVSCAALPETLIQAELFGYEKGAFTDARERRIGRIESAHGGTLLLDEIGDLPLALQPNLLRFLQEGTIERLGSHKPLAIDARVIAATHVDLQRAMQTQRFREDLYYRLNVLHLRSPSLREREGDVEMLAYAFLDQFIAENPSRAKGFSQEALNFMKQYTWPGNIRELRNRVRQAALLSQDRLISLTDLGLERRSSRRGLLTLEEHRLMAERTAITAALRRNQDNISRAAQELEISRVTLYRLMEKHELERDGTSDR